ncbi:MAG: NRDE family protein [Saprospiraceae bacterium]
MCTVTYLPTEKGYILTHNRDEKPSRSSQSLTIEKDGNRSLIYPMDQQAYGSWIFIHSKGLSACLLNGAFKNHEKNPKYRISRGKVLLSLAQSRHTDTWLNTYDFEQIEPFTMIICQDDDLIELVWDGNKKYVQNLGTDIPTIWSSSTLYNPEIKLQRKQIFYQWIDNIKEYDPAAWLFRFHEVGSIGDINNNIMMYRENGPRTISTSQVIFSNSVYSFKHLDRLKDSTTVTRLKTKKIISKKSELLHA